MAVRSKNAHGKWRDILRRHWVALGARHGVLTDQGHEAEHLITQIAERTPAVIAAVNEMLPRGFDRNIADAIFSGMRGSAERLLG